MAQIKAQVETLIPKETSYQVDLVEAILVKPFSLQEARDITRQAKIPQEDEERKKILEQETAKREQIDKAAQEKMKLLQQKYLSELGSLPASVTSNP